MTKSKTTTNRPACLSDLQRVLLAGACQRADGSLLPVPVNIGHKPDAVGSAIASLLKRKLVAETSVLPAAPAWREEGERRSGIVITDAGRDAIGCCTSAAGQPAAAETGAGADGAAAASLAAAPHAEPRSTSKAAQVLALLRRDEGAALAELVEVTGWLPHTTRAALTGLRKKGHAVEKTKRGELTCYRVAAAG